MKSATVHIIDDDPHICRTMGRLLQPYGYVVLSYPCVANFLSQRCSLEPACLVFDLKVPGITGWDVQQILSHGEEYLPIIFVSSHADIETSVQAMKAGAIDFLIKPLEERKLLSAVQDAIALSEQTLTKKDELKKDVAAFLSLTPREREVCIRIAQGLLNKQVGFELGTTEKTVKAQRAHVMQKLRASSLPDIVRLVERLRIAGVITETPDRRCA
jgi:FixJ family two-component response regulator